MIPLLLALLCVVANAFFVAAEFAFAKVRPTALEALERRGDARAKRAHMMTRRLDAYLSATQLGITLASLGLGWLGEPALAGLLTGPLQSLGASMQTVHAVAYTFAFAVISLLHIVVGELVPKSLAIQRPEAVARWTALPLRSFYLLTFPAMWVLTGLSNLILRGLRLPPVQHMDGKVSAEEIRLIIRASFGDTEAPNRKRDLLERVLRGTDRPVRAVMIPRVDMISAASEDPAAACLDLLRAHGYSRYPLCKEGNPDAVVGYVHVKDIVNAAEDTPLGALRRDIIYAPESMSVGDLLSQFQVMRIPIAIVVDEYGGTDGMVTVEDLVEEMVGEIHDEHDENRPKIVARPDGSLLVDGSVALQDLELEGLAQAPGDVSEPLSGYVVSQLGRLARPGDRVAVGEWDLVVDDVRRRRVTRVALAKRTASQKPDQAR